MALDNPANQSGLEPAALSGGHPWTQTLESAERALERKQYGRAIIGLRRAIAAGADGYSCSLRIAEVYRQLRAWPSAMAAAEQAAAILPARLDAYDKQIEIAMESGALDRAIAAAQAAIRVAPRYVPAFQALASAYTKVGDTRAAIRTVGQLIQFEPGNPSHRYHKALLCQDQGDVAESVREFMTVVVLEPEGEWSAPARDALETLDIFQLNQIVTLSLEDVVFRTQLLQDCDAAVTERGFLLSPMGTQLLLEYCHEALQDMTTDARPMQYH